MIKQILLYEIDARANNGWRDGLIALPLPNGAEIISIQVRFNRPVMWVQVSQDQIDNEVTRTFRIIHTGDPFEFVAGKMKHMATYQLDQGDSVQHLFEIL